MARYYFINSQGTQIGPVGRDDMLRFGITRDTLVWREGAPSWIAAGQDPDLASYFATMPPPPPPPKASAAPAATAWQPARPAAYSAPSTATADRPFSEKPPSYMWLAICTTLLCFLPLGIVSIVYASKVDGNWAAGDYDAAFVNSRNAKNWGVASASVALLVFLILLIVAACS